MIRNVIFDIGNVFVQWSPQDVIRRCSGMLPDSEESRRRATALFGSPVWIGLNLGKLTQAEAELAFQREFGFTREQTADLFFHVMDHQELIDGTEAIARRLKASGYRLFALTDNVREIVAYLKTRHRFWDVFEGAVVSAEVGLKKPAPAIFRHLIDTYRLDPAETVFFDDYPPNVNAARSTGLAAFLFTTPDQCERDLRALALAF